MFINSIKSSVNYAKTLLSLLFHVNLRLTEGSAPNHPQLRIQHKEVTATWISKLLGQSSKLLHRGHIISLAKSSQMVIDNFSVG